MSCWAEFNFGMCSIGIIKQWPENSDPSWGTDKGPFAIVIYENLLIEIIMCSSTLVLLRQKRHSEGRTCFDFRCLLMADSSPSVVPSALLVLASSYGLSIKLSGIHVSAESSKVIRNAYAHFDPLLNSATLIKRENSLFCSSQANGSNSENVAPFFPLK